MPLSKRMPAAARQLESKRTGTFDDLLRQRPPELQEIALRLRALVWAAFPKSQETIWPTGWRMALYKEHAETCGIQVNNGYCNLYFMRGAELPDPDGLLVGTGKKIRHVKVRSIEELEQLSPLLKKLLRQAKKLAKGKEG
ncbi:MAG: DUF1801 domain-containing protein [Chlorobi bacterium]|nr:MAG: hypothetical protein UZ07_CHB004000269 [Chlorobi bacterium OLB7]MBK8910767.1 DUF1801 domain-containing protein [Chlorobiota bacterium]MBX7216034.1 DUF1801 domain-containing protein [Candidatus Kapabacteria bacterium]